MKKRIVSAACASAFAAVVTFACIGTEPAEASQQSASGQQEQSSQSETGVYTDGPYEMTTSEGYCCVEYDIYNYTEDNISAALLANCYDESYTYSITLSSYIPCIGPNETASIYAVDYSGILNNGGYCTAMVLTDESLYVSASEDLQDSINITIGDEYLELSAVNLSAEMVWMPQVTVQFYSEDQSQWWIDSVILSEGGNLYLDSGSGASADIAIPNGAAGYYIGVTGLYNGSVSDSGSAADYGADDYGYSDSDYGYSGDYDYYDDDYFSSGSDYFRSSDLDPSRKSGEDLGLD